MNPGVPSAVELDVPCTCDDSPCAIHCECDLSGRHATCRRPCRSCGKWGGHEWTIGAEGGNRMCGLCFARYVVTGA